MVPHPPHRPSRRTVRRLLAAAACSLAGTLSCTIALGASYAGAEPISTVASAAVVLELPAQTTPPTVPATDLTPTSQASAAIPRIIPLPNTGHEPRDPGDRGGWWQEALFFSMCGAVLLIAALVWRDSRKQRRRQGRLGANGS